LSDTPTKKRRPRERVRKGQHKEVVNDRTRRYSTKHLSPTQARVLDALMSPQATTLSSVAELTGVHNHVISGWLVNHALFIEEYYRRIRARGDEIVRLNIRGVQLALEFHIEVLRNEGNVYSVDDRRKSAQVLLDLNRPRIDALSVQQVTVSTGMTSPHAGETIPSVQRFQAQGQTPAQALQADAVEMRLMIEQLARGADQVGLPEDGVIDVIP